MASNAENFSIWWRHHAISIWRQLDHQERILYISFNHIRKVLSSGQYTCKSHLQNVGHFVQTSIMMTSSNGNISALLALCAGNSPVTGEFPSPRPVTGSFDIFFDLRLNKRLRKQSWGWWFETTSRLIWRHRYDVCLYQQNHQTTWIEMIILQGWVTKVPKWSGLTSIIEKHDSKNI